MPQQFNTSTHSSCAIPVLLCNYLHGFVIICRMCEELHELLSYYFIGIIYQIIKYLEILSYVRVFLGFFCWFVVVYFFGGVCLGFFNYFKHLNFSGYFGAQNDFSTVEVNFIKVTFLILFYTARFNAFLFYTRIHRISQ